MCVVPMVPTFQAQRTAAYLESSDKEKNQHFPTGIAMSDKDTSLNDCELEIFIDEETVRPPDAHLRKPKRMVHPKISFDPRIMEPGE